VRRYNHVKKITGLYTWAKGYPRRGVAGGPWATRRPLAAVPTTTTPSTVAFLPPTASTLRPATGTMPSSLSSSSPADSPPFIPLSRNTTPPGTTPRSSPPAGIPSLQQTPQKLCLMPAQGDAPGSSLAQRLQSIVAPSNAPSVSWSAISLCYFLATAPLRNTSSTIPPTSITRGAVIRQSAQNVLSRSNAQSLQLPILNQSQLLALIVFKTTLASYIVPLTGELASAVMDQSVS